MPFPNSVNNVSPSIHFNFHGPGGKMLNHLKPKSGENERGKIQKWHMKPTHFDFPKFSGKNTDDKTSGPLR